MYQRQWTNPHPQNRVALQVGRTYNIFGHVRLLCQVTPIVNMTSRRQKQPVPHKTRPYKSTVVRGILPAGATVELHFGCKFARKASVDSTTVVVVVLVFNIAL